MIKHPIYILILASSLATGVFFAMDHVVGNEDPLAAQEDQKSLPQGAPLRAQLIMSRVEKDENSLIAELWREKKDNLPARVFLALEQDGKEYKKIEIDLIKVEWKDIIAQGATGKSFSIEVIHSDKRNQRFTISEIFIRDSQLLNENRSHSWKLDAIPAIIPEKKDSYSSRLEQSCINFIHRRPKTVGTIIILSWLLFLCKYHSLLFLGTR